MTTYVVATNDSSADVDGIPANGGKSYLILDGITAQAVELSASGDIAVIHFESTARNPWGTETAYTPNSALDYKFIIDGIVVATA